MKNRWEQLCKNDSGAMGYILLWAMGVPGFVLVAIFLMRGCH